VTAGQDRAFILHCVICIAAAEEVEEQAPSQPRLGELTASHVSPNSVQLEWSVPEGTFDSFTVQYIDVQGQAQELHLESGSRTVTVSGLLPSHPYKFNLYGLWGQTRLGPISTDTVTGEGPACCTSLGLELGAWREQCDGLCWCLESECQWKRSVAKSGHVGRDGRSRG